MKKILRILLVACLAILAISCSSKKDESKTDDDRKTTIGLVLPTLTTEFFVSIKEASEAYANKLGINILILDSQDDAIKQASNLEDLVTRGVDGILVIPTDSDAVASSIEDVNATGIPVITLDRSSSGGEVVSHIASDNILGGKMAGEYIVELLGGKGNAVELEGVSGTSAARDRGQGFNEAINETDIVVVAKQTANFNKDEGLNVMENILQAQPKIDVVFAHNDEMALGALEAIEDSGRDIIVVGFDASPDAVVAVEEGRMAATVAQKPELIATTGIDAILATLNGEDVESYIPVELELVVKKIDNIRKI